NLNLPAAGNSRRHGGDEGAGVGRVQPVRPVALFSGIMAVPASGKLTIPLEVPEYRGALRVMAIVVSGAKVGRAEAEVKVRDPIVLQATLPRTLLANDEFDVPVSLTNLSGRVAKIKVFLRAEDMLDFSGEGKAREDNAPVEMMSAQVQNIVVADKATAQVVYRAKVRRPSGAIRLVVEAESDAGRFRQTQEIPLGARGSRTRETKRISITERSTELAAFIEDYEPLTERTTVRVTSSPWGDVFEHLRHLIRYPYGCVEQTASTTRPLLFLGRIAGEIDPEILKDGGIEAKVQRGIQRLFSMQTPTGGFAYWPGGSEPTRWASAYVVHLLLDAQELGYPFPASRLDDALRWMEQELTFVAESDEASRNTTLTELRDAEPYMHYVLARAGRGRKGRMQQLLSRLAQKGTVREEENRYLLQAGLWRAGDRRYEAALRALDLSPLQTERYNDWSYLSDSRRRGLTLTLYGELFGRDAAAMPAADMVADMLRAEPSEGWSTQELVWGITGLGRQLAPANAGLSGQAILVSDGRPLKALPVMAMGKKTATSDRTFELYRASEKNSLRLEVPSADVGKGWVVLTTEGVKRGAVMKTGGDGLVVSRAYYDEKGNEALLDNLALGDLLFVVLTAENKSGRSVQNLALVDRLPAGFEIENPRLGRGHGADLIDESQLWQNDHLNVRDDRLEVFGHLNRGERKHVVYQVRAVTAGDFHAPPVELEAMYDPSLWARAAGGQVQVRGPWGP
ncbi:MAG: alpha-2-macroglobulin family protein, partial [Myxococcota bacterium]